jgi:hypothetical protein
VERGFDGVFPGLILGIKLRGTTITNISNHFIRTAFLILGAFSLLMGGGMLLAYRNDQGLNNDRVNCPGFLES